MEENTKKENEKDGNKKALLAVIIVILLALLMGLGYYFVIARSDTSESFDEPPAESQTFDSFEDVDEPTESVENIDEESAVPVPTVEPSPTDIPPSPTPSEVGDIQANPTNTPTPGQLPLTY